MCSGGPFILFKIHGIGKTPTEAYKSYLFNLKCKGDLL
jgi:hypothetical protein